MPAHDLASLAWPVTAIDPPLRRLAAAARLPVRPGPSASIGAVPGRELPRWVAASAMAVGLDASAVEIPHPELASTLPRCGPALLALPRGGGLLAIVGGRGRRLRILSYRTGRAASVDVASVCDAIVTAAARDVDQRLTHVLAGASPASAQRARRALAAEALRGQRFDALWLLRAPAGAPAWVHARSEGLLARVAMIVAVHVLLTSLSIVGWTVIGRGALLGRLEPTWTWAWALVLASYVPLYVAQAWLRGKLAIDAGRLLKRRLLAGAMRLDDAVIKRDGAGALIGRALEASALDNLVASNGLAAALASIELGPACIWLAFGSGGLVHAAAVLAMIGVVLATAIAGHRRVLAWSTSRRALTLELVEKMIGHRTRLAQCDPTAWHTGEDAVLARYAAEGKAVDVLEVWLAALPNCWLVLALLAMAPGFVRGDAPLGLAVALGGTAMVHASLGQVVAGLRPLLEAIAGWRQIAPLYRAADVPVAEPSAAIAVLPPRRRSDGPGSLLAASGVSLRYPGRARAVLEDASLTIAHGDRILVEGPSGGGKTTLAAVLAGLQRADAGLLLLDGFDPPTLGASGWHRRVAFASQYHDNHVFAETFIFNAMLGNPRWPPNRDDVARVREICAELGLDDLLERMAAGVAQNVGEGGWRLSHGERSRLFIARALLQDAPLVVLDESFAALDPHTLRRCLDCVLARAETLVVIAHP